MLCTLVDVQIIKFHKHSWAEYTPATEKLLVIPGSKSIERGHGGTLLSITPFSPIFCKLEVIISKAVQ